MPIPRRFLGLAVVAFLAGMIYFAFQSTYVGGVSVGDPLPELGLTTLRGDAVAPDSWRGRGLILRLSSSTCSSCADDFPLLQAWQERLGARAQVVAVQVGDPPDVVRTALGGREVGVPIVLDRAGDAARRLGIRNVPAVVFVTSRGTLSSVVHAEASRTDLTAHAATMLAGGPGLKEDLRSVARQVRCRECEGRSVWESDAASSIEMRDRIQGMLLAGSRPHEILEQFESEYGAWILMSPPVWGVGSLAWLLPLLALLAGAALVWTLLRRARRREAAAPSAGEPVDVSQAKERLAERIEDYM